MSVAAEDDQVLAAKQLASTVLQLGDGEDKRLFMNALVWASACAIVSAYQPEAHDDAIGEFSTNLKSCVDAVKLGMTRTAN